MTRGFWALALIGVGTLAISVVGCDTGPNQVLDQLEYDLTVNADRARFVEDGLTYQGTVGPYAVYKVTSDHPRLLGPYVRVTQQVGYAMLCGATHFFIDRQVENATLKLLGGHTGDVTYVATDQQPAPEGGCTPPQDTFGNPIPDGGAPDMPSFTPPGDNGGTGTGTTGTGTTGTGTTGTGTTGTGTMGSGTTGSTGGTGTSGGTAGTPTGSGTGTSGVGCVDTPCTGSGSSSSGGGVVGSPSFGSDTTSDPAIQRLNITFDHPPPIGSTVLLRRVALTGQRQHNGSHIIPSICCSHGQCSLGSVQ